MRRKYVVFSLDFIRLGIYIYIYFNIIQISYDIIANRGVNFINSSETIILTLRQKCMKGTNFTSLPR